MLGQRQEPRSLLGERLVHLALVEVSRNDARVGDLLGPLCDLAIEGVDGMKHARREERAPQIANSALDAALFITPRNSDAPSRKEQIAVEREQTRMHQADVADA